MLRQGRAPGGDGMARRPAREMAAQHHASDRFTSASPSSAVPSRFTNST
jgi:hypothetical protein